MAAEVLGASCKTGRTAYFRGTDPGAGAGPRRCPDPLGLTAQCVCVCGGGLPEASHTETVASCGTVGRQHRDPPEMNGMGGQRRGSGGASLRRGLMVRTEV